MLEENKPSTPLLKLSEGYERSGRCDSNAFICITDKMCAAFIRSFFDLNTGGSIWTSYVALFKFLLSNLGIRGAHLPI